MRLNERLAKQQLKESQGGGQTVEEEEALTYLSRKRETSLNEEQGVFQGKTFEGINTEKSVFDRTAVFRVGERP